MSESSLLLWSVLWSAIGLGYFIYGKKQKKVVPLFCGLVMMGMPYFVNSAWLMAVLAVGLMAAVYYLPME